LDRVKTILALWLGVAIAIAVLFSWAGPARANPGAEVAAAVAADASAIVSPIGTGAEPPSPWRLALLPAQSKPVTQFSVVTLEEQRVLRVSASKSYGKLVHPVSRAVAASRRLQWDWRVDRAPEADLRKRAGDDVALRVCAFFDWPLQRVPLVDRARLALAEALAGEALPTAAVCYVWDPALPTGTVIPNAFTRRVRSIVVEGGDAATTLQWREHQRDLHKDFRTAFADEWLDGDAAPTLEAVAIGADTDNTAGEGLAYLRRISLRP
jgi:hypothetical protein